MQNKIAQPTYGLHHAVWDEVIRFWKDRKYPVISGCPHWNDDAVSGVGPKPLLRQEFVLLARVADRPHIVSASASGKRFAELFSRHPDQVLELIQLMRKSFKLQAQTDAGKTRRFLLTHSFVRIRNKRDKIGTNVVSECADGEAKPVAALDAGEIAQILAIQPGSVTTERKALRKKLERHAGKTKGKKPH